MQTEDYPVCATDLLADRRRGNLCGPLIAGSCSANNLVSENAQRLWSMLKNYFGGNLDFSIFSP